MTVIQNSFIGALHVLLAVVAFEDPEALRGPAASWLFVLGLLR